MAIGMSCILRLCYYGTISVASRQAFFNGLFLLPSGAFLLNGEWTMIYDIMFFWLSCLFVNKYLKKIYPFVVLCWGILTVIRTVMTGIMGVIELSFPSMLLNTYTLGFVVGVMAFYLHKWLDNRKFTEKSGKTAIILFIICFILLLLRDELLPFNRISKILIYYFLVFVTILSALLMPVNSKNILIKIGDRSFGIYLIHFTVGDIAIRILDRFLPIWLVAVTAIFMSVSVGCIFDYFSSTAIKAFKRTAPQYAKNC